MKKVVKKMNEEITLHDREYPRDSLKVVAFDTFVALYATEVFATKGDSETSIELNVKDARQLATFLSDYCDKQGV